jgi:hypothetical protein
MIEWEGNSRRLERQRSGMPGGGGATHHGDIEDVSFYREAETTGMCASIGTDENACCDDGRSISERMCRESLKVLDNTLIVH